MMLNCKDIFFLKYFVNVKPIHSCKWQERILQFLLLFWKHQKIYSYKKTDKQNYSMAIIYNSETSMTSIINPFKWRLSIYFPEIVSQNKYLDLIMFTLLHLCTNQVCKQDEVSWPIHAAWIISSYFCKNRFCIS